jgi:uncharacterized protein (DUF3084 family)
MKRIVTLVALLTLTMVLFTGCSGVSQDKYDAAVKEASDLKAQLSSVQADITTAQADLSKSKTDLATAQQNLTTVTADRDSVKSQLDKAKADLTTAQANLSKSATDLATTQQSISTMNASIKAAQPYMDVAAAWREIETTSVSSGTTSDAYKAAVLKTSAAVSATKDSALITAYNAYRTEMTYEAENGFINLLVQRILDTKPKTQ